MKRQKIKIFNILTASLGPFGLKAIASLFFFLMYLIIGKSVTPAEFGRFSFCMAFLNIATIIALCGNNILLLKRIAIRTKSIAEALFPSLIVVSLNIFFIFFLFFLSRYAFDSWIYDYGELLFLLLVLNATVILLGHVLNGLGMVNVYMFTSYFLVHFLVLVLLLAIKNITIGKALAIYNFSLLVAFLVQLYFLHSYNKIQFVFINGILGHVLSCYIDGYRFFLCSLGATGLNWVDILLLGILGNDRLLGLYTAASRIVFAGSIILTAINANTTPLFARLYYKKNIKLIKTIQNRLCWFLFGVSVLFMIFFVVYGRNILAWFGIGYVSGFYILIILCSGQFVNLTCGPVGPLLSMTGYEVVLNKLIWQAVALNIILSLLLYFFFKIYGIAIATSISIAYWNIKGYLKIKNILNEYNGYG